MHNIFDSAFLKGYFFPFRIRSVHRCRRRRREAAGLDVLRCVSATPTFAFPSVTVSCNVCKAPRRGMQSSELMEGRGEVISAHKSACARVPQRRLCACQREPKGRAPPAGRPLLQQHVLVPLRACGTGMTGQTTAICRQLSFLIRPAKEMILIDSKL